MSIRKKLWLSFSSIIILAILAGLVAWPSGPDIRIGDYFKELKVHLGLDLQGGAHLLYSADTSELESDQVPQAMEGVRDVIERRVNAIGVSEPIVQTSQVGSDWRLIVELPGVTDISQAINTIGETPFLEFREQAEPEELTPEEKEQAVAYNAVAEQKAQEILDRALAGEDFAALAQETSEGPSAEQGGDLGWFARGQMVPEFEEAVFSAELNQVIPRLIETEYGYHIIKVNGEQTDGQEQLQRNAQHVLVATQPTGSDLAV